MTCATMTIYESATTDPPALDIFCDAGWEASTIYRKKGISTALGGESDEILELLEHADTRTRNTRTRNQHAEDSNSLPRLIENRPRRLCNVHTNRLEQ